MAAKAYPKTKLVISLFSLVLFVSTTAHSKIIYVDSDVTGVKDGSSWQNAYQYLQDALSAVQSGDEIHVAQGIYTPDSNSVNPNGSEDRDATFQLINGVTLKGGYAGFGQPDPNARDIAAYETILSGDLNGDDDPKFSTKRDNVYHVVTSSGTDVNSILDGFTITGGFTYDWDWPMYVPQGYGAGIYNYSGHPTVRGCTFTDNFAYMGGGMYNLSGIPALTNCTFSGNDAWFGGGVYNDTNSPAFTDCIFSNNSAWLGGAGMYNQNSNPTLENCTFSSNKVEFDGGGMYNQDSSPILTMCTFSDNLTLDGDGGGMYNVHGGPTLTNCTFSGNSSFWDGGGMSNYKSSPTLTNCIFSTNFADEYGGGIENRESDPTLTKCMFTGNWANCGGGAGIVNWYSNPILSNCMFSGNTVGERWGDAGGGMLNIAASSVVLTNCTFAGNSAPNGDALACNFWRSESPSNIEATNCIFWDGDNGIWNNDNSAINITYSDVQGGWKGKGNIDADPCFVSPGYWGHEDDPNIIVEPNDPYAMWFDGDYHLLPDSPCIDAGDKSAVPPWVLTDLDGKPRIIYGRIDMGAYEYRRPIRIVPRTINLSSKGKWITCYIWLPEGDNVADIDPNSILLENKIQAESLNINKTERFAIARFIREDVQPILEVGDIELTITGRLTDGIVFEATDTIKVIDKADKK